MTRNLIVDGTKEVIANGRAMTMHAISKPTDYTHQRIVGYAVTLEDAHLFAAAEEMREAAHQTEWFIENGRELGFVPVAPSEPALKAVKAALSKSEVR